MGLDVFCIIGSCFVLTKLCTSGFSCLPLSVVLLIFVYENPKKKERMPFGLIHVCLFGANVILKLLFGSCLRCLTTFLRGFPLELCFCVPSVFPFFPVQKGVGPLDSPGNRSYPR